MDAKCLLGLLLLVASSYASKFPNLQNLSKLNASDIPPAITEKVGEVIGLAIVHHFQKSVLPGLQIAEEVLPRAEITLPAINLPPIIELGHAHVQEYAGGPSSGLIVGDLNFCDSDATNLDSINHTAFYTVEIFQRRAIIDYSLFGSPQIIGSHSLGAAFLMSLMRIRSNGPYEAGVTDGFVNLTIVAGVNSNFYLEIKSIALDIGFGSLDFDFGTTFWGNATQQLDWVAVSEEVEGTFNDLWPVAKIIFDDYLGPVITRVLNRFVSNCRLDELPELLAGDLSCLGLGPEEPELPLLDLSQFITFLERSNTESCNDIYYAPTPSTTTSTTEPPSSASAHAPLKLVITIMSVVSIFHFLKLHR